MNFGRIKAFFHNQLSWFIDLFPRQALPLTLTLLLINVILIALVIPLGLISQYNDPGRYFREGRIMTWLSFFQLVAISKIAAYIYKLRSAGESYHFKNSSSVWRLVSWGFAFLAFDEIARVHEALDRYGHKALGLVPSELSDRADDLIILAYGLIGLFALFHYRREITSFLQSLPYFIFGFALFFMMVLMDIIFNGESVLSLYFSTELEIATAIKWLSVIEDIFKNFAEVAFIGGFAACYQMALNMHNKVLHLKTSQAIDTKLVANQRTTVLQQR